MPGRKYTKEDLLCALTEIEKGGSLRKVAIKCGIPPSTLQDYKKKRYAHNPHPNRALTPEEEETLVTYILWMSEHGFPVTGAVIKTLALTIIKASQRTTLVNLDKGLSTMWWSRFKARHPEITSRTLDSMDLTRFQEATVQAVEAFFVKCKTLHQKHSLEEKPHLIFSCNETWFWDTHHAKEKDLCKKSKRHIYSQEMTSVEHITVHCCVSAAGESIPPFVIYPRCLPSTSFVQDGPDNALYGVSAKGHMNGELFLEWLTHFVKYAPAERPLLLYLDKHETRVFEQVVEFCRANSIEVVGFPSHTAHILQPLNVAVFGPLKAAFLYKASRISLVNKDSVVGKCQFSAILKHAYHQAVTPEIIKQGFRRTGLFPLCRNAVNTSQMVKQGPSRDGSLPGFPSPPPSATSMLSASTAPEEYSACQQLPNPLMPRCIIPESLADVLGFPRFVKLEQTNRCLTLSARGKTSNKGTVALKRKQQRWEKKGKKEIGQKQEKRKRSDVPSNTTNQYCTWQTDVAPPQSSDDALIYKMEKVKVVTSSNGSMQETPDVLGPSQVSMSNQERRNPPLAIRIKTSAGYSALLKQKKRERKRRTNKDVVKRKREERRQTCTLSDASNCQLGVQCDHVVSPQSSDNVFYRAACLGCDTLGSDHDYAQNENSECSAHMTIK